MFKRKIEERGLKKVWIADKLNISKQLLNYYLDNSMPSEIEKKLREILK